MNLTLFIWQFDFEKKKHIAFNWWLDCSTITKNLQNPGMFVLEGWLHFNIVLQLNTFSLILRFQSSCFWFFYIHVLKNMTWPEKVQDEDNRYLVGIISRIWYKRFNIDQEVMPISLDILAT